MDISKQNPEKYGYDNVNTHPSYSSSKVIVSIIDELFNIESVMDVGCGVGIWLREFMEQGVHDVFGVDGSWIQKKNLVIPDSCFRAHDLRESIDLDRRFDLVLCLEVAEHIPEKYADRLVESIAAHGDLICFSAAIPGQGGFEHHNEQYQNYWINKFENLGYSVYDPIRPKIWNNSEVAYYYSQNILVFSSSPISHPSKPITSVVHPNLYERRRDPKNYSLRDVLRYLPHYVIRAVTSRFS